ncbi:MAG TPA: TonB family protein [Blastocatellia bacterium]|nr:TonB family protein [Blastocatellia bacterium]
MSDQLKLVVDLLLALGLHALIALPLGLIPALIAKKKGRSFSLWWMYGAFAVFYAQIFFAIWWAYGKGFGGLSAVALVIGIFLAVLPFVHAILAKPPVQTEHLVERSIMGQSLVVSSDKTGGDDRAIYFFDTMGIWATIAFLIIFIPGVVIIDAQLSKTGETAIELATPPPAAAPASAPKPQPKNQPAKQEAYIAAKEPPKTIEKPSPPKPMERVEFTGPVAQGGASGGGAPGGIPGGIIGGSNPTSDAPPPPPPPPPPAEEKPKPEPPKIVRKSGGVLQGSATRRVTPTYPPLARAARVSGSVVVEVTVDEAGNVMSARAVSGHPLLKDAAVAAARGWKFTPTQLSGVPVKVIGTITFNFTP